jgi:hypothetical protein
LDLISDRDKLFVSKFWKALHELTGIDIKMSTSYHPESDGVSERTNKTVVQMLHYHVEQNQKGWVKALPKIRFQLMNTVNASTGYLGFQLRMGHSARVIPPLIPTRLSDHTKDTPEGMLAIKIMAELEADVAHAKDCLLQAKIAQSASANSKRSNKDAYAVGDLVLLSTKNCRNEYKKKNEKCVAKFFPRFDGPFCVVKSNPELSTYCLDMPNHGKIHKTFHSSQLKRFTENDAALFRSHEYSRPGPIITADGLEEFFIDKIIDSRKRGKGM